MTHTFRIAALSLALLHLPAMAQTTVKEPWVRGTVAQQMATGAFFQISNAAGARLVSASSPAAGVVEIHSMTMEGGTMKMRALPDGLDLPAGKTVELKPGGYHVMLMDLKAPLKAGDSVDLSLVVEGKDGKQETIALKAPVKALGAMAGGHGQHRH
jgi:periplasmic copper chaperone A